MRRERNAPFGPEAGLSRRSSRVGRINATAAGVAFVIGVSGCGGGDTAAPSSVNRPPTAPPVAPPPTAPPVSVAFAHPVVELTEGDTAEVVIRYSVVDLPAAWNLHLLLLPGTATGEELVLSVGSVEIPAEAGASGGIAVSLAASTDLLFAEGDETAVLRFVPDPALNAELGDDLEIVIREAGATPCDGVHVEASPPSEAGSDRPPGLTTQLTIGLSQATQETAMHFAEPYFVLSSTDNEVAGGQPMVAVSIAEWRSEESSDSTVHELQIEWPQEEVSSDHDPLRLTGDPDLRLRFTGGPCDGEAVAMCSAEGCELIP